MPAKCITITSIDARRYQCLKCCRNFNSSKLVQLHLKVTHNINGGIKCDICGEKFCDQRSFETHVDRYHREHVSRNYHQQKILRGDFE